MGDKYILKLHTPLGAKPLRVIYNKEYDKKTFLDVMKSTAESFIKKKLANYAETIENLMKPDYTVSHNGKLVSPDFVMEGLRWELTVTNDGPEYQSNIDFEKTQAGG